MTTVTTNLHQRTWAGQSQGVFPPTSRQNVLSGMSRRDWQDVVPRVAQQQAGRARSGPSAARSRPSAPSHAAPTPCGESCGVAERPQLAMDSPA